ncbi:1-deoxy-D-xylulose-5-phosphate synthase 1 [Desulfoluna limicola]|uniref:1-deoxy-D-xylulose-5-phosphate synthase n=1 Tax=Desulfoluna limicola TaxID=2810562 RepID=A0ABM7PFD1_9BACT|nr:1-deoxy-D-xylulose-5-phosphate synthase [Desulfoluna limicola]BCS95777.1 1-deoxy-D-xylulose-5-phosphate synthase 1 [Desulfoluna limicola]
MTLLKQIDSPTDLRKLDRNQLPQLAREIRENIVDVVSKNGGHLASSLGVVELTIAIHYVFDVPFDKVIWDVGHQAYAHKLLTGRRDAFPTLRTRGGLSGFPKVSESPYDAFTTGHSSTSVSAGYGISCAREIKGEDGKIISVIGDGSLTGGIAYEGLNQSGPSNRNHLVILNDNEMSIAKNVGALSSFLSRTFSAKYLQDLKGEFKKVVKALPKVGDDIYQFAKKTEESFKAFVTPGMLFEAFKFEYFGPIDGHNLEHLIDILENIKKLNKPVLLHVMSKKGKGYAPAEANPVYFHGVSAFEKKTGASMKARAKTPSYTDVFGQSMVEFAKTDKRIVAVTAAMPEGTGLSEFSNTFPDRFFDVGIAEQHGVTFAAGMATEGLKPVVAIYSTFLQRAYDQILHDVCLDRHPVIFAVDRGGIVGEDGPTHHGLFDLSYLRPLPNMVIMAPADENELRRMMKTALDHDGPIAIRYPRGAGEGVAVDKNAASLPVGRGELVREGSDVLLLSIGTTLSKCLEAAERLSAQGIEAAVINARFVKPLDRDLIVSWAEKTGHVVTVEEHMKAGGFGSAILELLASEGLCNISTALVGVEDHFVEHGSRDELCKLQGISTEGVIKTTRRLLGQTNNVTTLAQDGR